MASTRRLERRNSSSNLLDLIFWVHVQVWLRSSTDIRETVGSNPAVPIGVKMKQVVIINNSLKMSKGKIARVCLMLGYLSKPHFKSKWLFNNCRAVILKSEDYEAHKELLTKNKIKYWEHIDAGYTSVEPGSHCGLVCFLDKDCDWFENLKLL